MKTYTWIVLLVATLTGCVSTKNIPLQQDTAGMLEGRSIGVVKREKPDFAAMTAEKAMFAAVGAVAMISAGNRIIEDNAVSDPADYISQSLADALSQKYGMLPGPLSDTPVQSEKVADIAAQYPGSDILIDIRTVNWSFAYFPTDWDNYRVIYSAKLRLIDASRNQVLAESFCSRVPENSPDAPTHEALLANNAQRLKQELRVAADYCIAEFSRNALNL